jgi:hypothetical protein
MPKALSPGAGVKRLGHEADHSPPSSALPFYPDDRDRRFVTIYQTTRYYTIGNNSYRYENLKSYRSDVPVHNQNPRQSGGIAPSILNLGIRWG